MRERLWSVKRSPRSRARDTTLAKALGPEDARRFIRSFDPGSGDYTKDRKNNLKNKTVKQIGNEILEMQKSR